MPDWLWERIELLLPERPAHPLGCHNPRVPDRDAMDAILLVLRTGAALGAWLTWLRVGFFSRPGGSATGTSRPSL
jgi:transposase